MGRMLSVVDALKGARVFAELPAGLPGWVGVCEVLLQERLKAWAFAASDVDLAAEALRVFGRRARVGVRGARTPEQVRDAAAVGVHFITSTVAYRELLEAAGDTPIALGALTPNEIQYALGLGSQTVQVVPGDSLGMSYARALADMFGEAELLPIGRLEPFQCDMWRDSGAKAVGLAPGVLFPTLDANRSAEVDLDVLRRRVREFV
jgi:2-dehydro-3-deoxyphosphogluconate aldolase / (4S)-4-hydroxy-2-oxoglutarate aldolase